MGRWGDREKQDQMGRRGDEETFRIAECGVPNVRTLLRYLRKTGKLYTE